MKKLFLKISKHLVFLIELWARFSSRNKENSKVIFICGVPRCGSTILYQELTNTLKFGYTDNFTHYVTNQSFIGGNIASEYFLRNKAHNCFKSNHGDTSHCGLCAPSEGGKYWSKARKSNQIEYISQDFSLINTSTKKPYIVKNLHASLMIDELSKVLPDAKFIYIKRDKKSNVGSLLTARKKLGISGGEDWSVMPNYDLPFESESDRVNFQYDEINRIISHKLKDRKKFEVDYHTFISNKENTISELLNFCFKDD